MNRRLFFKNVGLATAAASIAGRAFASPNRGSGIPNFIAAVTGDDKGYVPVSAAERHCECILLSVDNNTVSAKHGKTGNTLLEDTNAEKVIEWAMANSPLTVLQEGVYTVTDMVEVPRAGVSLLVCKGAVLTQDPSVVPTSITEGHGIYRPLIYNKGHDNVKIVNLGVLKGYAKKRGVCIHFDGRNGGACGINGGLIFSVGELYADDAVWVVDSRNVEIPLLSSVGYGNAPLAVEGCEDMKIGTVTALEGEKAKENEAIDFNSFSERMHVRKVIATTPAEEVVDVNNTRDSVIEEVVVYGNPKNLKIVHIHEYGPGGRRFTQKPFIPDSKGTYVKEERVVKKKVKSWETTVNVPDLLQSLPVVNIDVELVAVFEDGTLEKVIDEKYHLYLQGAQ